MVRTILTRTASHVRYRRLSRSSSMQNPMESVSTVIDKRQSPWRPVSGRTVPLGSPEHGVPRAVAQSGRLWEEAPCRGGFAVHPEGRSSSHPTGSSPPCAQPRVTTLDTSSSRVYGRPSLWGLGRLLPGTTVNNDPSAGSPTDTLLRLLLPLGRPIRITLGGA